MTTPRWGVYCLANDLVLDWALALFESLREFAPELPLLVIPYDERQVELGLELHRAAVATAMVDPAHGRILPEAWVAVDWRIPGGALSPARAGRAGRPGSRTPAA
mgnify:CR=1 FL=1